MCPELVQPAAIRESSRKAFAIQLRAGTFDAALGIPSSV
jgi:hypothetical protein